MTVIVYIDYLCIIIKLLYSQILYLLNKNYLNISI